MYELKGQSIKMWTGWSFKKFPDEKQNLPYLKRWEDGVPLLRKKTNLFPVFRMKVSLKFV